MVSVRKVSEATRVEWSRWQNARNQWRLAQRAAELAWRTWLAAEEDDRPERLTLRRQWHLADAAVVEAMGAERAARRVYEDALAVWFAYERRQARQGAQSLVAA